MNEAPGDNEQAMQELLAQLNRRPQHSPRSELGPVASSLVIASSSPSQPSHTRASASAAASLFPTSPPLTSPPAMGVSDSTGQISKAHLLNLLNFGSRKENDSPSPLKHSSLPSFGGQSQQQYSRGISTSDLVGSSMGKPGGQEQLVSSPSENIAAPANPQDQLLSLLSKSQQQRPDISPRISQYGESKPTVLPGDHGVPSPLIPTSARLSPALDTGHAPVSTPPPNHDSAVRVFGSTESREPTPFEPHDLPTPSSTSASKQVDNKADNKGIFTYVNPFEQLASSRKNALGATNGNESAAKHRAAVPAHNPEPIHQGIAESIEIASPSPLADSRSRVEALMGIGAPTTDPEVFSKALENVTEKVEQQAGFEGKRETAGTQSNRGASREADGKMESVEASNKIPRQPQLHVEELTVDEGRQSFEDLSTQDAPEAMQDMMDEAAAADDEESSVNDDEPQIVPVYNIPLRPFVAIELAQKAHSSLNFREKSIHDITRVKKEFDQVDRNLVTASNDYIVYSIPKKPFGIRVITQEDGKYKQLFKENDPIFNVSISSAPPGKVHQGMETVIATGTSGSVYWSVIKYDGHDQSQDEHVMKHCLVFPPFIGHDGDHTSGGQLKTRAKKSNRHPEYFAIGRGKTIQIVFPFHAMHSKFVKGGSVVEAEAYFKERSIKISTGKAGKDFTFSEDDTVVASLDKTGRLRFWDVRDLVDENNGTVQKLAPMEVNSPIMSVPTAHVNDKAWPTSVMFVDKLRPYARGCALRYVIVGMKQNHTLQLWDLSLGKVVQELSLPHENESDAICSVAYHPATGIVVVGHPTRNSIYLIHLSAPKYNLPGISQAKYLQSILSKDSVIPKPESTAIMSGIREYSFASKGQIRSLDLLSSQMSAVDKKPDDDRGQFELYVMHSKGVTLLTIRKADLGWGHDNKVITKVNGEEEGIIKVRSLAELRPIEMGDMASVNGDAVGSAKGTSRTLSPVPEIIVSKDRNISTANDNPFAGPASTVSKGERRKKKKADQTTDESFDGIPPPAPVPPPAAPVPPSVLVTSSTVVSSKKEPKTPKKEPKEEQVQVLRQVLPPASEHVVSGNREGLVDVIQKELSQIETNVRSSVKEAFEGELKTLRRGIDEDRRTAEATSAGNIEAVLRLVSQSLTENVDAALNNIVSKNIRDIILPAVSQSTEKTLRKSVPEWLHNTLQQQMISQLKAAIPEALNAAIRNPQVLQSLTEGVTSKISKRIDRDMQTTFGPQIQKLITNATAESQQNLSEQLRAAEVKSGADDSKFERLTMMTEELLENIRRMSEVQSTMRDEMSALQEEVARLRLTQPAHSSPMALAAVEAPVESPKDKELYDIMTLINSGNYEEGTIKWLQSRNQDSLFTQFFYKYDPSYLQHCPGLVCLSVGAAVLQTWDSHLMERIQWVTAALNYLNPLDEELSSVAPKIMDLIIQRLESRYMSLAEINPNDPILRQIPGVVKRAREIKSISSSLMTR